jgi:hypothetical protein
MCYLVDFVVAVVAAVAVVASVRLVHVGILPFRQPICVAVLQDAPVSWLLQQCVVLVLRKIMDR